MPSTYHMPHGPLAPKEPVGTDVHGVFQVGLAFPDSEFLCGRRFYMGVSIIPCGSFGVLFSGPAVEDPSILGAY